MSNCPSLTPWFGEVRCPARPIRRGEPSHLDRWNGTIPPFMRKLRIHMSQMTFQWLCIVAMAGVIIWLVYGVDHAQRRAAGQEDVPSSATRADDTTPVTTPVKPKTP